MPKTEVGRIWDELSRSTPLQLELPGNTQQIYKADVSLLYMLIGEMVQRAGGADWLATAMDREPSYGSKIREALAGNGDRKFHVEMLAPLLRDADALDLFLVALSDRFGYEPPIRTKREVEPEQEVKAFREVIAEMDPDHRELYRRKVAKKLGVMPEDLKP